MWELTTLNLGLRRVEYSFLFTYDDIDTW